MMLTACTPRLGLSGVGPTVVPPPTFGSPHMSLSSSAIARSARPARERFTGPAIEADHLVKTFDDMTAVDDVSFAVPQGSVLGLLGPNGAGKTTTVRMMTTLSIPTSGTARVAGHDVLT